MRVLVATVKSPFIRGGGEILAEGLIYSLRAHGHEADIFEMPFRFSPPNQIIRSIAIWKDEELTELGGLEPDLVICLKFPSYYLKHSNKVLWLLHQHREVYDLWGHKSLNDRTEEIQKLRTLIIENDNTILPSFKKRFTISKNVSSRLYKFNNISSCHLYHPPNMESYFYNAEANNYIFFPSRLEVLKRQDLFIKAMQLVSAPVYGIIAGNGGCYSQLEQMILQNNLVSRIKLLGRISRRELISFYANALAVFFGPFDEDYGYVTLEAMLSSKPLITCNDSGGPLEFVENGITGLVVEPKAEAIAEAIDWLSSNRRAAKRMGNQGKDKYMQLNISWTNVVTNLLG